MIALNKIDLPDGSAMAEMVAETLRERGYEVYPVSAASREGLTELTYAMSRLIQKSRAEAAVQERTRIVLRPVAVDDSGFTVKANADESFTVAGAKIERWVRQTDFRNAEAIGYLADRMAQLGVERELFKKGAIAGSEVRVGVGEAAVVFDWEPTIEAGAELLGSARGEDARFDAPWRGYEKKHDQLNDDEIADQWEYKVADPHTPELVIEDPAEEEEDVQ